MNEGAETISVAGTSYACQHMLITWTDSRNVPYKMDVWAATSLRNFPVKEVTVNNGQQFTTLYEDISLSAPDSSLFVPPNNCRVMAAPHQS